MEIQFIVSLIVLALLGIIDSGYLTYKHFKREKKLVCPIGDNCSDVVESDYGKTFGIKNEILGLIFYLSAFVIGIYLLYDGSLLIKNILLIGSGLGVLFSGFLTYIQAKILKNYCFYCLISAALTVLIFIVSILIR
ncbi:MAG: vitamin K epoxide reductase family protein [Candidatus Nanoarchaeia archaeon]|jgi:uncharacterized membrane protein|nr:vitamin K epoxide reductase family protein [Candidatus Nanoarchaeia archaeon]|tara:strand:- start:48171 stop:48578 length:408 start_codon:yes stop_codon:yes gene_type:complete